MKKSFLMATVWVAAMLGACSGGEKNEAETAVVDKPTVKLAVVSARDVEQVEEYTATVEAEAPAEEVVEAVAEETVEVAAEEPAVEEAPAEEEVLSFTPKAMPISDEPEEEEEPETKTSKFGPLKFGEDYDIKRDGQYSRKKR